MPKEYIITISCTDVTGIVAEISGFLSTNDCFIVESSQYGDPSTNKFFMRAVFTDGNTTPDIEGLRQEFKIVADKFGMDWKIRDANVKPRTLILCSKQSHCISHLLYQYKQGRLNIDLTAIASNHGNNQSLSEWHEVDFHYLPIAKGQKAEQEQKILDLIEKKSIDLVILARYMQILSPNLCKHLKGKAINIHHSFLPSFKGAKPYLQAYNKGVKIIGATAHYVTENLDEGPIIEQEVMRVDHSLNAKQLEETGQDIENLVLARAVKNHLEERVILNGTKTVVFK